MHPAMIPRQTSAIRCGLSSMFFMRSYKRFTAAVDRLELWTESASSLPDAHPSTRRSERNAVT
jgi:hypothetical protein